MKIVELNEMELMTIDGGGIRDRSRSHESRSGASSHGRRGSGNHGCSRRDDGSRSRIDHIREATGGLAKSGWKQMGESFKCKKR